MRRWRTDKYRYGLARANDRMTLTEPERDRDAPQEGGY